jgi:hypothetical protein
VNSLRAFSRESLLHKGCYSGILGKEIVAKIEGDAPKAGDRDIAVSTFRGPFRQTTPTRASSVSSSKYLLVPLANFHKGQGLEVLIFSNAKIKQSSHCCGGPVRRLVAAAPIDGRTPSAVFCVGLG